MLVYSRDYLEEELSIPKSDEEVKDDYTEADERGPFRALELRNTHRQFGRHNRANLWYPLFVAEHSGAVSVERRPHSVEVWPRWEDGFEGCWTWGIDKAGRQQVDLVGRKVGGRWKVYRKAYSHTQDGSVATRKSKTILMDKIYATEKGQSAFDDLMGHNLFPAPKPVELIKLALAMSTAGDDIILDFFAGSGTTAHAVLEMNRADGGNRKFILVQLPDPTDREDYRTIEITKERVRRVINKLRQEKDNGLPLHIADNQDHGFRAFKLAESNFRPWNAQVDDDSKVLEQQLELHVDHIRESRSGDDILYEILLKSGFPLTTPVESVTIEGKTVHSAAGGAFFICLERQLTLELIRAMAGRKPERIVCLDEGFAGNDQLKANAVQIFKTKGVTTFRTV